MSQTRFTARLLSWFDQHGRKHLPWQQAGRNKAYGVWVSEIMLQQTQVQTVIPYYQRFMQRFPDIDTLASAPQDEVLHHWSGLGYYARARNLHKAAQLIVGQHAGIFPDELGAVLALPGIGKSTAGAILAFSFEQRHPILDGNVKRVLTRFFGIAGYPGKRDIENRLWALADGLTPAERVADYTQAIMDLGATLCTRSKPHCKSCPQNTDCIAYRTGRIADFPEKKPKPKKARRQEFCYMLVLIDSKHHLGLEKRPPSGIWGGLFCFPRFADLRAVNSWLAEHQLPENRWKNHETDHSTSLIKHSFTHFDLSIQPLFLHLAHEAPKPSLAVWYNLEHPKSIGLPAPVKQIIQSLKTP